LMYLPSAMALSADRDCGRVCNCALPIVSDCAYR